MKYNYFLGFSCILTAVSKGHRILTEIFQLNNFIKKVETFPNLYNFYFDTDFYHKKREFKQKTGFINHKLFNVNCNECICS